MWTSIMHYIMGVRFLVVNGLRIIALFADKPTQVKSYTIFSQTNALSLQHSLNFWDFFFEYMGYTVNFGFYTPLTSIIEPERMT